MRTGTPPTLSSANRSRRARPPRGRPIRPRLLAGPLPSGIAGDPGWFGPGSQVWHIWRERLLLLGGPAAVLLQLAHPLIAAGVAAHSSFRDDPLSRLRAVLNTTLTVVFGDRQQATAAAARVGEVHRRVQGRLPVASGCFPAGSVYRASDPQLALWVHAILVMVALEVVDQFVSPLRVQQRAGYYQQSNPSRGCLASPTRSCPTTIQPSWSTWGACCTDPSLPWTRRHRSLPPRSWRAGCAACRIRRRRPPGC